MEGKFPFSSARINKTRKRAYNKVVEEIRISERQENGSFITYLYNGVMSGLLAAGGEGELIFAPGRTALGIRMREGTQPRVLGDVKDKLAEIVGIGYKYHFLRRSLNVSLRGDERRLLLAALISADLESDKAYIRGKISPAREFAVDGFYDFCLGPLREKWERIASYVPSAFSASDLKKFCAFLAGESRRRVYLRGNTVFGENFAPLRRSRLTGAEDMKTEIVLSDAGLVYCLGKVEDSVSDFLQKYYAERAIFS